MNTTHAISQLFAGQPKPGSCGHRTLAMESMEDRVVLTAAMPLDAPNCADEPVVVASYEVVSYEVEASLPAPSDGSGQLELVSEFEASLPAPNDGDDQLEFAPEIAASLPAPSDGSGQLELVSEFEASLPAPGDGSEENEIASYEVSLSLDTPTDGVEQNQLGPELIQKKHITNLRR